jgi:hypothetical protein
MENTLLDILQDGMVDAKVACMTGKVDRAVTILQRLLDVTYEYKVGNYLNKLKMPQDKMLFTGTEYGYINIEKNGKKGSIIL